MQDLGLASGIAHQVDIPSGAAYPRLVTKDTTLEDQHSERMDAAEDGASASEPVPDPRTQGYYAERQSRFIAAVRGLLPISEYVKEVAAEVDRRFPRLPQA
jgi:hypothetical protein